jgi:hypothetical protein
MRSIASLLFSWAALAAVSAQGQVTYSWTDITPPGGISSIATHPLDGRKLIGLSGKVVVASDDRGATWSAVDAPASSATFAATRLFVHPGRPDTVYLSIAPTDGNIRFGTFPASAELYRSRDFGRTWTRLPSRGSDEAFMPSAADPLDMSGLYAAHAARSAACGIAVPGCIIYPVFGASRSVDEGPAGTVAVRRYLNLLPDFNHRWVADASLIPDMRARGWADEGVRFCARPLGSNE